MTLGSNDANLAHANTLWWEKPALVIGWGLVGLIGALVIWLGINLAATGINAAAAQTEACRPECAVGPYTETRP